MLMALLTWTAFTAGQTWSTHVARHFHLDSGVKCYPTRNADSYIEKVIPGHNVCSGLIRSIVESFWGN